MEQRALGSQGLVASAQGLGCMGLTSAYNTTETVSREDLIKLVKRAGELGVTLLDSANVYGPPSNEELLREVIQGEHEKWVVATKFGLTFDGSSVGARGDPAYIRECCDASLKALGVSTIELYYQHRIDAKVDIEKSVATMKELVQEGKVKYLGLSEVSAADLRKAHAVHPITAVQLEWSLWSREVEEEIIPTCRELGIGIVAYSPLGRGFLTGKYTDLSQFAEGDFRLTLPRFQQENLQKNLSVMEKVSELAKAKGCTPAQLALAWLHHQGKDVFPIPGTKHIKYLEDNVAAFNIKLSPQELKTLEEAVPASKVIGDRYGNMLGIENLSHDKYHK
ncbi:hypothetical protein WJX73_009039 [Symbiochloris irregularis]|uniref:NADP-dependent oxidoreductase domain-containing protein n=1 Tax=Symbiochloris irregularis TaxID=706552 RepID=A0AAW1NZC6_9CHLO